MFDDDFLSSSSRLWVCLSIGSCVYVQLMVGSEQQMFYSADGLHGFASTRETNMPQVHLWLKRFRSYAVVQITQVALHTPTCGQVGPCCLLDVVWWNCSSSVRLCGSLSRCLISSCVSGRALWFHCYAGVTPTLWNSLLFTGAVCANEAKQSTELVLYWTQAGISARLDQ